MGRQVLSVRHPDCTFTRQWTGNTQQDFHLLNREKSHTHTVYKSSSWYIPKCASIPIDATIPHTHTDTQTPSQKCKKSSAWAWVCLAKELVCMMSAGRHTHTHTDSCTVTIWCETHTHFDQWERVKLLCQLATLHALSHTEMLPYLVE